MTATRVIRKYGNRRLYDSTASQYVNLTQVAELVRAGEQIEVVDAKTGEDLTGQVLTQIIVEDSRRPEGAPPVAFLQDLIRATDRAQRDFFQWYLSTAALAYERIQGSWRQQAAWPPRPAQWQSWLKMWDPLNALERLVPPVTAPDGEVKDPAPKQATAGDAADDDAAQELRELRRRLEELEQRLGR
jgi:polyhydroxyalkanoate synthesis repressor PhaR